MQRLFKLKKAKHSASTRLEDYLIRTAKTGCSGAAKIRLKTLDGFYNALKLEKERYVENHHSARITSVRVLKTETSVTIGSADISMPPTATIELMSQLKLDEAAVSDSLLIPLKS